MIKDMGYTPYMLKYLTLLDPSFDLEKFINETFDLYFVGDNGLEHVEGQRNYMAGLIDTLFRVGKISEETRAVLHLVFFEGVELAQAQEVILGVKFDQDGNLFSDLATESPLPLPPEELI